MSKRERVVSHFSRLFSLSPSLIIGYAWRGDCQVRGPERNLNERISIFSSPVSGSSVRRTVLGRLNAASAVIFEAFKNRAKRLLPPQKLSSCRRLLPERRWGGRWESAVRSRAAPGC